jgi:septal ring factor EnvC (AmiA/AmiB activator)
VRVTFGQRVAAGRPIGLSGDTGNTDANPRGPDAGHGCEALPF